MIDEESETMQVEIDGLAILANELGVSKCEVEGYLYRTMIDHPRVLESIYRDEKEVRELLSKLGTSKPSIWLSASLITSVAYRARQLGIDLEELVKKGA